MLVCKRWNKENIRRLMETDENAFKKGIVAIYKLQTKEEQEKKESIEENNIGFGKPDAEFLSNVAIKIMRGEELTPAETAISKNKIKKYSGQLARIANANEIKKFYKVQQQLNEVKDVLKMVRNSIKNNSKCMQDYVFLTTLDQLEKIVR